MHQRQRYPEVGETARNRGRVDLRAPARQDERGQDGSRQTTGGMGTARREVGSLGVRLLMAVILVSVSGGHAFGATVPPPADLVCSITQLTRSTSTNLGFSLFPSINAAGTRIAFGSRDDLTGGNPGHSSGLFLIDTTTGSLTQLTTGGGGVEIGIHPISINAEGTRIAIRSTGGNLNPTPEIFLVDTTTGSLTQLTTGGGAAPAINAAGTRIAFGSSADLTGGNPDHNSEIFLADTTTGSLTQLTTGGGAAPAINAAGTRIAFESNADLTGDNANRKDEIFLVDITTGSFIQLTHSTDRLDVSSLPAINAAGTRIAFNSTADLTGGNPDHNSEIFLADTTTGSLTQLTGTAGGDSTDPLTVGSSINAAGTRIAFRSRADLTGDNADGNEEIFLVDTTTGKFTQVTHSTPRGATDVPVINAAGTRIAFSSTADLTGDNAGRNRELFLATCLEIVNDRVTFAPLPSTFQTTANTVGCPAGFAGKFSFTARLMTKSSSPALTDLQVRVRTLTNGNLLQNADGGPGGAGATLTVSQTGALADGILSPAEAVDVPFVVCLQQRSPFSFVVDVLGGNL